MMARWLLVALVVCGSAAAAPPPVFGALPPQQPGTVSIRMQEVKLVDLFRLVYAEILARPFVIDSDALQLADTVTVDWPAVKPAQVERELRALLEGRGYQLVDRNGARVLAKRPEQDKPEDELIVYRPRYRSVDYLTDIGAAYGRPVTARGISNPVTAQPMAAGGVAASPMPQAGAQMPAAPAVMPQATPGSALSFIDRQTRDVVALMVKPQHRDKLLDLLADLDTPAGEVVLRAAVYEVGTTRDEGSALQLALAVSGLTVQAGATLAGPSTSIKLSAGGLDVLASALDADTRFRAVSRPHVRVTSGAEARFAVGADVPVLGQAQLDRNGNPVQSVEYRSSGVILTVRPDVRQEVVEMHVTQELSNFVVTQTGVNGSPTLQKRSVSSRLTLRPGEVVALAGLQDDTASDKESRVPLLGWMLGETKTQRKSEVLVFIEAQRL